MTVDRFPISCNTESTTLEATTTEFDSDGSASGGRPGNTLADFVPVLRHGAACDKGPRHEMQDCHVGCDSFETPAPARIKHRDEVDTARNTDDSTALAEAASHAFYAIFDGHGGVAAAEFASSVLLEYICEQHHFLSDPQSAMTAAFLRTDWEYFQLSQHTESAKAFGLAGTTALAAIVSGNLLVVANAGDSRAVLSRSGKAVELSSDHKPCSTDERTRICEAGGFVCCEDRINGELTVSRAIGDYHLTNLKVCKNNALEGPLTAEPDIRSHQLDEKDEFMLMACDGLWDVVSSQAAVTYAASRLRQDNNAAQCAQDLVQYAIDLNSGDNVSVIVVCFREEGLPPKPAPPPRTGRSMLRRGRSLSSDGLNTLSEALRAPPTRLGSRLQSETLPEMGTQMSLSSAMSPDSLPINAGPAIANNRFLSSSRRDVHATRKDCQSTSDNGMSARSLTSDSSYLMERAPTAVIPELAPLII